MFHMNKRMLSILLYLASTSLTKKCHILLSTLTSNSFAEVSLVSVYHWHLSQSISHTQNFANLIFKKSQIRSPWNCKYRLKASLFASQSQRKRTKIQKAWEKPRDHLRLWGKVKGQWFDDLPLKLPHVSLCNSTRSGHGGTQICVFECA